MNVVRMSRGCWSAVLLWPLFVCAAPETARAQPQPPPRASAPVAPSGAASGVEPSSADVESAELAADAAFQQGNELADRGELDAALAAFERAYALSPAYEVLFNIGVVNHRRARWASARRAFEHYLKLGGQEIPPARAAQVREAIIELTRRTATLRLMLNVTDAEIHIDGTRVQSNEVTGLILDPGEHVVRVSKPGFKPLEQVLRTANGDNVQVVLPLAPLHTEGAALPADGPFARALPPRVETMPTDDGRLSLWVPWTVTAVLAAGWMTTAGLAIKARHDRNIIERPGTSPERIDDARQLHQTLAIVSDILLVSTLASAGVSAYLTWWPRSDPISSGSARATWGNVNDLTLGVWGQF